AIDSFAVTAGRWSSVAMAAGALLLAFMLPALLVMTALRWAGIAQPTAVQRRAKHVAFLAVAAPPLYGFLRALQYMDRSPSPDLVIGGMFWLTAAAYGSELALPSSEPDPAETFVRPALRVAHGIAAVAIILIFLGLHLANHLTGLAGAQAHETFMK